MQTAQGYGDLHEAQDDEAGDLMLEELLRHGRAQAFGQVSVLYLCNRVRALTCSQGQHMILRNVPACHGGNI